MGRHKVWRKLVKKLRRKRLRQKEAKARDAFAEAARKNQEQSPTYQAWLEEQDILEQFREEEEARLREQRQKEWEVAEINAERAWCLRQERAEKAKKEREEQEIRIRKEWEEEQLKIQMQEEEKKKELEEKQKRQAELMQEIIDFVDKGGERPLFANNVSETNPNMPLCPFFTKTGACRFGDRCSRNHPRPALSKVVLLPNFYSHFGMDQSMLDEYDSDLLLEYEDSETYQHFREFYNDVVPELYRYGQPVAVVICCNAEPHLRGNLYVEYAREAESAKAVTSLNGRWYGGKLLTAQFTNIPSWKAAICGLFHRGRCPKGKTCNFLHVFQNPGREFSYPDWEREKLSRRKINLSERNAKSRDGDCSKRHERSSSRQEDGRRHSQEHSKRDWRWSESPERVVVRPTWGKEEEEEEEEDIGRERSEESRRSERRREKRKAKRNRRSHERCGEDGSSRRERRSKGTTYVKERWRERSNGGRGSRKRKSSEAATEGGEREHLDKGSDDASKVGGLEDSQKWNESAKDSNEGHRRKIPHSKENPNNVHSPIESRVDACTSPVTPNGNK